MVHIVTTGLYKGSISVIQTSQLILYREIIAVCSEIHTKHINTVCGQNVEFFYVGSGGTCSDHWNLKSLEVLYQHLSRRIS